MVSRAIRATKAERDTGTERVITRRIKNIKALESRVDGATATRRHRTVSFSGPAGTAKPAPTTTPNMARMTPDRRPTCCRPHPSRRDGLCAVGRAKATGPDCSRQLAPVGLASARGLTKNHLPLHLSKINRPTRLRRERTERKAPAALARARGYRHGRRCAPGDGPSLNRAINRRRCTPGCRCNRSPTGRIGAEAARRIQGAAPSRRCRSARRSQRQSARRRWRRPRSRGTPPIRSARQCRRRLRRLQACLSAVSLLLRRIAGRHRRRAGQGQRESENLLHISSVRLNRKRCPLPENLAPLSSNTRIRDAAPSRSGAARGADRQQLRLTKSARQERAGVQELPRQS